MKLIVGTASTWSMRAWLCLRMAKLSFEHVVIRLDETGYRDRLARHSPSRLVPVLDTGRGLVHDSLAIAEYANELCGGGLLPKDQLARAQCRSLCAELHAGFQHLRRECSFAWNPVALVERSEGVRSDLERLGLIWDGAASGFYFGKPSMADAFYAVMAYRLARYGIELHGKAGDYQRSLIAWPLFAETLEAARAWEGEGNRGA